jgi:hypothetical protein
MATERVLGTAHERDLPLALCIADLPESSFHVVGIPASHIT